MRPIPASEAHADPETLPPRAKGDVKIAPETKAPSPTPTKIADRPPEDLPAREQIQARQNGQNTEREQPPRNAATTIWLMNRSARCDATN